MKDVLPVISGMNIFVYVDKDMGMVMDMDISTQTRWTYVSTHMHDSEQKAHSANLPNLVKKKVNNNSHKIPFNFFFVNSNEYSLKITIVQFQPVNAFMWLESNL